MDAAGLTIDQLGSVVSSGSIPDGVDVAELQKLSEELAQLGSTEFADAANAIEQYGIDECDVVLAS